MKKGEERVAVLGGAGQPRGGTMLIKGVGFTSGVIANGKRKSRPAKRILRKEG